MSQLPDPGAVENITKIDSHYRQSSFMLLDRKQWLYVQNQFDLTPRELQIAELICQGLRNGKIANYLHIRPGTVKAHIRNIYQKVHVKSKMAMLLKFMKEARRFSN